MSRLTIEHVADAAIHCTIAGMFVGLVMACLTFSSAAKQ